MVGLEAEPRVKRDRRSVVAQHLEVRRGRAALGAPLEQHAAGLPPQLRSFITPRIRRAMAALTAVTDKDLDALAEDLAPLRKALGEFGRD